MENLHFIDRLEPLNNLTQEVPALLLSEPASELSQIVEVSSVTVLHEQVEVV